MRINVVKYLIFGPYSFRDKFFAKVQKLGVAEFISPRPEFMERPQEIAVTLVKILKDGKSK